MLDADADGLARIVIAERALHAHDSTGAGMIAAYCLDGALVDSASSLDALLRGARSGGAPALGTGRLLEDLAALSPVAAGRLAALLKAPDDVEVGPCLERHGLAARSTTFVPMSDSAIDAALGARLESVGALPLLRVAEASDDSPLAAGDLFLRVAGSAVSSRLDVAHALAHVTGGAQVELSVRRAGEARTLSWRIEAVERSHGAPERAYLELTRY